MANDMPKPAGKRLIGTSVGDSLGLCVAFHSYFLRE
jgi:hypothetical protein